MSGKPQHLQQRWMEQTQFASLSAVCWWARRLLSRISWLTKVRRRIMCRSVDCRICDGKTSFQKDKVIRTKSQQREAAFPRVHLWTNPSTPRTLLGSLSLKPYTSTVCGPKGKARHVTLYSIFPLQPCLLEQPRPLARERERERERERRAREREREELLRCEEISILSPPAGFLQQHAAVITTHFYLCLLTLCSIGGEEGGSGSEERKIKSEKERRKGERGRESDTKWGKERNIIILQARKREGEEGIRGREG